MELRIIRMGQVDYRESLDIQEKIQKQVMEGLCSDTLLLLEHPPVLTMGIRGNEENILLKKTALDALGVQVVSIKRGGDVTYLGPGQIIGYPIMDLKRNGHDIHLFVNRLEQIFTQIMQEHFNTETTIGEKKYTGVFVGNDKLTAIGISVSRWVTMHGFAFNVNTDLSHFDWIIPCGLKDKGVTSVQKITGSLINIHDMQDMIIEKFEQLFGVTCVEISKKTLLESL